MHYIPCPFYLHTLFVHVMRLMKIVFPMTSLMLLNYYLMHLLLLLLLYDVYVSYDLNLRVALFLYWFVVDLVAFVVVGEAQFPAAAVVIFHITSIQHHHQSGLYIYYPMQWSHPPNHHHFRYHREP